MTTLRFPDDVPVSGHALLVIAATLGIDTTALVVGCDGDTTGGHTFDLKAGGWLYERLDDEDQAATGAGMPAGVTGFPVGSRTGVLR